MSSPHGYGNSGSPLPPPQAVTNYSSISHPSGHPQGQDGRLRSGFSNIRSIRAERRAKQVRSLKVLAIAVLVAFIVGLVIKGFHLVRERREWDNIHLPVGYDVPAGVKVSQCATSARWNDISPNVKPQDYHQYETHSLSDSPPSRPTVYPFAAKTSFDLPLGSGDDDDETFLAVVSRGRWLTGDVKIAVRTGQERGKAIVDVVARSLREDTRTQVRACLVEKDDGSKGVGVFTPQSEWRWGGDTRRRQVHYEITVSLPYDSDRPLMVRKLETDVFNALQRFELPPSSVSFGEVILKGRNGSISSNRSLDARRVEINVTDSTVSGTFVVTEHLGIESLNGSVWARVWAKHSEGLGKGPNINLKTSNGSLEGDIHLVPHFLSLPLPPHPQPSPNRPHYGVSPSYDIQASTSGGLLNVTIMSVFPHDVKGIPRVTPSVRINGTNTNGPASVTLYHTYSGAYDVQTSPNGTAQLRISCKEPSGSNSCPEEGFTKDHREATSPVHLKGDLEWVPDIRDHTPQAAGQALEGGGIRGGKSNNAVVLKTLNGRAILAV